MYSAYIGRFVTPHISKPLYSTPFCDIIVWAKIPEECALHFNEIVLLLSCGHMFSNFSSVVLFVHILK